MCPRVAQHGALRAIPGGNERRLDFRLGPALLALAVASLCLRAMGCPIRQVIDGAVPVRLPIPLASAAARARDRGLCLRSSGGAETMLWGRV